MDAIYIKTAMGNMKNKQYSEALTNLNYALEENPNNGEIYYYFGNLYYDQEKLDEASSKYDKAIEFNVKLEDCYRKKGMIKLKQGFFDDAIKMFDLLLKINPNNYYAYYIKGKIDYEQKKFFEAIRNYEMAINLNKEPRFVQAKEGHILSYAALNQRTEAFDKFKQYFCCYEDSSENPLEKCTPEVLAFKARLHKEFKEYHSAMDSINLGLRMNPNDPLLLLGDKVVYLYYLNKFQECITEGTKVIELRKKSPSGLKGFYALLFYIGCSYLRLQDSDKAEIYFKEYEKSVIELYRKEEYYIEKARIETNTSTSQALEYINKALAIYPKSIEALKFKISLYQMGDIEEKEQELKELNEQLSKLHEKPPEDYNAYYDEVSCSIMIQSNLQSKIVIDNNVLKTPINISDLITPKEMKDNKANFVQSNNLDCDLKVLGKGGFGNVYIVKMYNNEEVALKKLNTQIYLDQKEKDILQTINHPNIVKYLGFFKNDIMLELCQGGDLFKLVISLKIKLPLKFKYKIIRQIAEALKYLHQEKEIIHGDIKNKNILLDKEYQSNQKEINEYPNAKLCDFGLSKLSNEKNYETGCTPLYTSPEVLNNKEVTFQSDVYSFGLTMYELFSETVPFSDMTATSAMNCIIRGIRPRFEDMSNCPKELIQLMIDCCNYKPEERISIDTVLSRIVSIESSNI